MITERLNKAYPFRGRFSDSFNTFAFISSFIAVFVFIFRSPDMFPDSSVSYRIFSSLLYGLTTFLGATINTFFIWIFVTNKVENNWKIWKEILLYLLHFFTISVLLYILHEYLTDEISTLDIAGLFKSFLRTLIVGIIPVTIHVLVDQNKLFKQYYLQAQKLEPEVQNRGIVEQDDLIEMGDHEIPVSQILFVESNKNYLDFFLENDHSVRVRMTMKEFEDKLSVYPQFIRCHRAYTVNLDKIVKVEGNAQGLRLTIKESETLVPVSRTYIPSVSEALSLK